MQKKKEKAFQKWLKTIFKFVTLSQKKAEEKQLSFKVRKLRGIIKTDNNFDYKQALTEEISRKYGI